MAFSLSLTIKNILKDIFKLKNDKIDASRIEGTIPIESLPPASIERVKVVQNEAARLALTKAAVQNGDTVKVKDTKKMYFVVDDTKLNQEAGYEEYVSGGAASAEIAEKAKLALNSEKLGGLTLDAFRTEIKGYPANIQNGSIKNQHLAADFSFPGNKLADGSITNNKLVYKSITIDKIADGVLTAANVGAYSKSETYNKNEIGQSFRKIGDKVVGGSVDWNTLTEPVTYKIHNAIMDSARHAPPNEYNFGILVVHRLENGKDNENRTVQVYYPHATRGYWSRMLNGSGWLDWRYIPTHNELQTIAEQKASTRVNKSGDTMTGTLHFANEGTVLRGTVSDNDSWRLFAGRENGRSNEGYLTLDTADDGTEGIYVRQFTGDFQNEVRYAKLLGPDGTSSFPISVTSQKFYVNDWYRCNNNGGIHWEKYGGGWYMQDSDWIRAYNNKHIYTGGKMKADGGFEGKATSAGRADSAERADSTAVSDRAVRVENDNTNMRFHWSGQGGQPTWLWGGNNPGDMYVYNPSNFTVNRANTAGRADSAATADFATKIRGNKLIFENGTELWIE
jgi:hypothetical protein